MNDFLLLGVHQSGACFTDLSLFFVFFFFFFFFFFVFGNTPLIRVSKWTAVARILVASEKLSLRYSVELVVTLCEFVFIVPLETNVPLMCY
jgi:hypothetical protein